MHELRSVKIRKDTLIENVTAFYAGLWGVQAKKYRFPHLIENPID